jgi:hypothetical protein
MEYVLPVLMALVLSFFIIKIINNKTKKKVSRVFYRQSDMHVLLKTFFSRDINLENKPSQIDIRNQKNMVKVIAIDEKAYWVSDNIFYVADLINNEPDFSTTRPVDTSNMSKTDIDKMLFILDNLGRGNDNDSSSSGNE